MFGAALRNGLAQPWAVGPTPPGDLGNNAALSGSVVWTGRLLGLTPQAETVAGAAELAVDLLTMSGALNLAGLEHWPADAASGNRLTPLSTVVPLGVLDPRHR